VPLDRVFELAVDLDAVARRDVEQQLEPRMLSPCRGVRASGMTQIILPISDCNAEPAGQIGEAGAAACSSPTSLHSMLRMTDLPAPEGPRRNMIFCIDVSGVRQ
jgi:hypothetical protein